MSTYTNDKKPELSWLIENLIKVVTSTNRHQAGREGRERTQFNTKT